MEMLPSYPSRLLLWLWPDESLPHRKRTGTPRELSTSLEREGPCGTLFKTPAQGAHIPVDEQARGLLVITRGQPWHKACLGHS